MYSGAVMSIKKKKTRGGTREYPTTTDLYKGST